MVHVQLLTISTYAYCVTIVWTYYEDQRHQRSSKDQQRTEKTRKQCHGCQGLLIFVGNYAIPYVQIPYGPELFSGLIFTTSSPVFITARIASIFVSSKQCTHTIFIYLQSCIFSSDLYKVQS